MLRRVGVGRGKIQAERVSWVGVGERRGRRGRA